MAFISVTRLRPRGFRFLPTVAIHTWRSRRQLRRAKGFIGGYLGTAPHLVLWTVTVWTDEASMREFRNAAPHLKAMPKLIHACDEASVIHWTSDDPAIPSPAEAAEKMKDGKISKVRHPSPDHEAGKPWPDGKVPLQGPRLIPVVG